MAAWLVSQYSGMPAGSPTAKCAPDIAIQRAIWAIIHNSVGDDASGYSSIGIGTTDTTVAYWVNQAETAYTQIDPSRRAVVSWVVDANGNLLADDRQTFLVQIVPEPGFYGLLGPGLSALIFLARRRQSAAS